MSRRISKERAEEFSQREQNIYGNEPSNQRLEKKRQQRLLEKQKWEEKMKQRGGLVPRKAKYWGDDCDIKKCEQWMDGSCQYEKRDQGICFMDTKGG